MTEVLRQVKTARGPSRRPRSAAASDNSDVGRRHAVIDIGSNSVRLVIFSIEGRSPIPIFNEKVLCGLGSSTEDGRLDPDAVRRTSATMARFRSVIDALGINQVSAVATAAVRDAADRDQVVDQLRDASGYDVRVVSGEEEARLAAMGVLCGMPSALGLAGDLGGASLELIRVGGGQAGRGLTLPLGPLRLASQGYDVVKDLKKVSAHIDAQLESATSVLAGVSGALYVVGGSWRALASAHMAQTNYPIHVLHGYEIRRDDVLSFSGLVEHLGKKSLAAIKGVSKRRVDHLPLAALLLERLFRVCPFDRLVVSAFGIREGLVMEAMPPSIAPFDPLVEAASHMEMRYARSPGLGVALQRWTDAVFADEAPEFTRLRRVACHVSDTAWRRHPDYRARQLSDEMLYGPWPAVTHAERVGLSMIVGTRYWPKFVTEALPPELRNLGERYLQWGERLGLVLRLGYLLSGATPDLLIKTSLTIGDGTLKLSLGQRDSLLMGESVVRRLEAAARAFGLKPEVETV